MLNGSWVYDYLLTALIGNGGMMHSDNWQQNFAVEDTISMETSHGRWEKRVTIAIFCVDTTSPFCSDSWWELKCNFLTLGLYQDTEPYNNPFELELLPSSFRSLVETQMSVLLLCYSLNIKATFGYFTGPTVQLSSSKQLILLICLQLQSLQVHIHRYIQLSHLFGP